MNAEEIRARLAEANRLDPADGGPGGTEYVEAMRALVPHAETLGQPELLFTVRLSFAWALRFKPLDKGSASFFGEAWPVLRRCLLTWHAEPHRFAEGDVRAMWNQFFLNVDAYVWLYPEPADRIHRFLDELERYCPPTRVWTRYAIEHRRMFVDARRGDVEAVERRWHALRAQGDPEEHFHLDGKAAEEALMWQRLGRNDRALEVLAPLAAGQIPARDGMEYHADGLILPYLHSGRVDEAVDAHRRTYARPGMKLGDVAAHLEFCARTGNEERGIEVLHRNLRYFEQDVDSVELMWTAAAAALLCHRVLAKDLDSEWTWPCGCDTAGCDCPTDWSYAELGSLLRWEVVTFAEKVDALNGTGFQGERIRALLAAEPVVGSLPLPPADHAYTVPARDPATATGPRLAFLESRRRGRFRLFTTVVELVRAGALHDPHRRDRVWDVVPTALDWALTRPTAHTAQIDGLLRALEPHCRPGSGDLHCLRWFRVELEVRRADADAARTAWTAFADLPPDAEYATPANEVRRATWWLDLGGTMTADDTATGMPEVAVLLNHCAGTGDLARGEALLHRHLDLFRNDRNDDDCSIDRVRLYDAVARLCDSIVSAGQDHGWTWPGDECCEPEDGWTWTRLGGECRADVDLFSARWRELGVTAPTASR